MTAESMPVSTCRCGRQRPYQLVAAQLREQAQAHAWVRPYHQGVLWQRQRRGLRHLTALGAGLSGLLVLVSVECHNVCQNLHRAHRVGHVFPIENYNLRSSEP